MGSLVGERRGAQAYTVGLYMGWGVGMHNDRTRYEIKAADEDSVEAVLASAGWRLSFIDLTRSPEDSWARMRIGAREWGLHPVELVPAEVYDALIYIDAVTPPEYL
jgi:erythromycin esterase-like protein